MPSSKSAGMRRRSLIGAFIAAFIGLFGWRLGSARRLLPGMRLRPPGALPEDEFSNACVNCFKCGNACPNACIKFYGVDAGLGQAFTPYIKARERGCILCGKCAEVCPTGALAPFEATPEGWLANVHMGVARVNKSMCFSYHGRTCGACYQACPLQGTAILIGVFEQPTMVPENCVGCGLCEQACLHLPQAIRVIPMHNRKSSDA